MRFAQTVNVFFAVNAVNKYNPLMNDNLINEWKIFLKTNGYSLGLSIILILLTINKQIVKG